MFTLLRSNKALNRTTAHPLDSAVRIAHHEDDLAALHYRNKVRAVIFKRDLPPAVKAELGRYEVLHRGITAKLGPAIKINPFKSTFNESAHTNPSLKNCPAIMADMAHVAALFYKASGRFSFSKPQGLNMTQWYMDIDDPETKETYFWQTEPHIDTHRADSQRMTCAYTEERAHMGTGWFPGSFSLSEAHHIAEEYSAAGNPQTVLDKYNHQTTDAGDLVFFHTELANGTDTTELSLLHNSPIPPPNKVRLCLLLPT